MATGIDTNIPVASDGAGDQKIRQWQFIVQQPDGTIATVNAQVVGVIDEKGRPIDLVDADWKDAVLQRLDTLAELLAELTSG